MQLPTFPEKKKEEKNQEFRGEVAFPRRGGGGGGTPHKSDRGAHQIF